MLRDVRTTAAAQRIFPVLIEPGDKRPLGAIGDWNRLRTTPLTEDEIAEIGSRHPNAGLGVVGGYLGLVPIDIDTEDPNIKAAIVEVLGKHLVGKRGRCGATIFGRDPAALIKPRKFRTADGTMIMDLLVSGQVVIPPTRHPETQRPYKWLTEHTLLDVRSEGLPELPLDLIEQLEQALAPWLPLPKEFNRPKSNGAAPSTSLKRMRAYAEAALDGERQKLVAIHRTAGATGSCFTPVAGWVSTSITGCYLTKRWKPLSSMTPAEQMA